jgi:hypothetical protein
MTKRGKISTGAWLWPSFVILMLIGMMAEASRTHIVPADASRFHEACTRAIDQFPYVIASPDGTWKGWEVQQPDSAIKLLKPLRIVSRNYARTRNDGIYEEAALLLVDCPDARDLQGHYPPNCYPSQGEKPVYASEAAHEAKQFGRERTWHLPHMDVHGMEYRFSADGGGESDVDKIVYNFFVIPRVPGFGVTHKDLDGVICKDITGVYISGQDYQRHFFGASEFQLVFQPPTGSSLTPEQEAAAIARRDQAFVDILGPNENLIWTLENRDPGGK